MNKLKAWNTICLVCAFCAVSALASSAQTFTTMRSFDGTDGQNPLLGPLVQGLNGNFYGTTLYGGANRDGTVFRIAPNGQLTTLYSFCAETSCTDGRWPEEGLVQGSNGTLYGTTYAGGGGVGEDCGDGCGTVFALTATGGLTTLYTFCSQTNCTDGAAPVAGLVEGADGSLYGTTIIGGANLYGTVFKITGAALTILHSFDGTDGSHPQGTLVRGTDGNFYGTTVYGGANNLGTVFKITPGGTLTTLYSFCSLTNCADGEEPYGGVVQGTDGNFYGTTFLGGAQELDGTIFKITPKGQLTTLYNFCSQTNCADGLDPEAGLTQGTDRNFYGTTSGGGADGGGTIFKITAEGLTTLYSFCAQTGCSDGAYPYAGVVQGTDGSFYGTTSVGGTDSEGTVFSLSVGLGPFVETLPASGKVGATVEILGNNLSGATSVTFNGTTATFTAVSNTEIRTIVPTGATTGTVDVVTSNKTLKSKATFVVTP